MGMFKNLTTENLEQSEDRVGGFEPLPSGVYDTTIKLAYVGQSGSSDAVCINLVLDAGGREVRERIWITNGKGENFYVDKQNAKKKHPLPGFTTVNDICLFASEVPLSEQDSEEKMVKIWNADEKKEVPTPVQVLTGLTGGAVKLAILREIVDKEEKGDDGKYHPTGDTRTQNQIDKALHPETGRTINEYEQGIETPDFMTAWLDRNNGKDRNRVKKGGGSGGSAGSGRPGGATSARKSLFNKD